MSLYTLVKSLDELPKLLLSTVVFERKHTPPAARVDLAVTWLAVATVDIASGLGVSKINEMIENSELRYRYRLDIIVCATGRGAVTAMFSDAGPVPADYVEIQRFEITEVLSE